MKNLEKEYTEDELGIAMAAVHDSKIADKLLIENSPLVVFLMDMKMQQKLFHYFDEMEKSKNTNNNVNENINNVKTLLQVVKDEYNNLEKALLCLGYSEENLHDIKNGKSVSKISKGK